MKLKLFFGFGGTCFPKAGERALAALETIPGVLPGSARLEQGRKAFTVSVVLPDALGIRSAVLVRVLARYRLENALWRRVVWDGAEFVAEAISLENTVQHERINA